MIWGASISGVYCGVDNPDGEKVGIYQASFRVDGSDEPAARTDGLRWDQSNEEDV
jgi:hypothetical protein